MKTILILFVVFTLSSCYTGERINIKLDGNNKIIFKDGDVIYFTSLDTTRISFHSTDDPTVKDKNPGDIILSEYIVEYKNPNQAENNIFKSIERHILKISPSPKQYICDQYNSFAKILEGDWGTFSKYKNKNLIVKQIDWDVINELVINDNYFNPGDSLNLGITIPSNTEKFCSSIKSKQPDAKYIIMISHVYLIYNILKGIEVSGSWSAGTYIPGFDYDDAYVIAPITVIDINNAKILSIDTRRFGFMHWENLTIELPDIIQGEAEYYNLFF